MDPMFTRRSVLLGCGLLAAGGTGPLLAAPGPALPAVIDASVDTTGALPALAAAGVRAIIRYYAKDRQPNLPTKILGRAEADAIRDAGMAIGIAYQFYNNKLENMTRARGLQDAAHSLRYAADVIGQPAGSAIYFGVDGDWPKPGQMAGVVAYFTAIAETMDAAGKPYRVGVYGSGRTCAELAGRGLAELFWLARSTGWTGTPDFYNGGGWSMYQNMHEVARGGIRLDTNIVNPTVVDQGFFDRAGPVTAFSDKTAIARRRFVGRKGQSVFREPDHKSPVVTVLKPRSNVAVTDDLGEWAGIDYGETGTLTGYCPSESLGFMHRMPT
jgi:hypothetical protein